MTEDKGFTAIMVRPSTHTAIKAFSIANDITMCELVDVAVSEYIARHTRPDFRHVAAASDPINGDGIVTT